MKSMVQRKAKVRSAKNLLAVWAYTWCLRLARPMCAVFSLPSNMAENSSPPHLQTLPPRRMNSHQVQLAECSFPPHDPSAPVYEQHGAEGLLSMYTGVRHASVVTGVCWMIQTLGSSPLAARGEYTSWLCWQIRSRSARARAGRDVSRRCR